MRPSSLTLLLFGLSVGLFFLPQGVFAKTWLGLAESAPLALVSVLVTVLIDRNRARADDQQGGQPVLLRRLATGFLVVAGVLGVEIAVFYLVLTLPGAAARSGYPLSSLWAVFAASNATIKPRVLHLGSHFALSSALAAGYGVSLIALAVGPVWSGSGWGWQTTLATGLVPAGGVSLALLSYPVDHPYFAVFPAFWLCGTVLAWRGSATGKVGR